MVSRTRRAATRGGWTRRVARELHEVALFEEAGDEVAAITRPERYWLLAETGDEVLDYSHAVIKYAGARQTILEGGNHGFSRWKDYLDAVIDFAVPAGDDTR